MNCGEPTLLNAMSARDQGEGERGSTAAASAPRRTASKREQHERDARQQQEGRHQRAGQRDAAPATCQVSKVRVVVDEARRAMPASLPQPQAC